MYKIFIRPLLFKFHPETIHHFVFSMLKVGKIMPFGGAITRKLFKMNNKKLHRKVFGLDFPNPVGLAAGLDKDAHAFEMLGNLGFGFVEIGTVTPKSQSGNPKPRLFRLKKDEALINRMGFNNLGVEQAVEKLKNRKDNLIIGGNIGKNTATPNEKAKDDYIFCFNALYDYVDYFVVNVSCPNVANLRKLQDKDSLVDILSSLKSLAKQKQKQKPILLKISPDLNEEQLDEVIEIIKETSLDGIVATNTTTTREDLSYTKEEIENIGNGGLSGKPLKERSTEIIRYLSKKTNGEIPIVGVGGIMTASDAMEKLNAGASLVQIYSGFIYSGVGLIKSINKAVLKS